MAPCSPTQMASIPGVCSYRKGFKRGPFVRALEPQSSEVVGGAWFLKAPVLAAPQLLDLSLGSSTAVSLLTLIVLHVASVLFQSGEIKVPSPFLLG